MILERTYDNYLLKAIMTNDEMWSKIKIDDIEIDDFEPVIDDKAKVICALEGKEVIGLHLFTDRDESMVYHPMLLYPYRKQYGREFLESGLKWYFDNTENSFLDAEIPADNHANLNLAKHFKFKEVGSIKQGVSKDNELIDLTIFLSSILSKFPAPSGLCIPSFFNAEVPLYIILKGFFTETGLLAIGLCSAFHHSIIH